MLEIDAGRAEELRQAFPEALVVEGDATDRAGVADFARQVEQRFGGLDVLVNNVGDFLMLAKPFEALYR